MDGNTERHRDLKAKVLPLNHEELLEHIMESEKPLPKMVFSVIGDSNRIVPKPWKKSIFQKAFIDAARNAGDTWIIFRGYKDGVSKMIYDAYTDYFKTKFYNNSGKLSQSFSKDRVRITLIRLNMEEKEKNCQETQNLLGSENSHQLRNNSVTESRPNVSIEETLEKYGLVKDCIITNEDSGKRRRRFREFLAEFEYKLSVQWGSFFNITSMDGEGEDENIKMRVPVMLVVMEGDMKTIKHTALAVTKHIPVLIVKGSGKAADLIVKFLEEEKFDERTIQESAPLLFGVSFDKKRMEDLIQKLNLLAENRHLLHVFDVNSDDPLILSKLVGEAIVRSWAMEEIQKGRMDSKDDMDLKTEDENKKRKSSAVSFRGIKPKRGTAYVRKFTRDDRPHVLKTKFLSPASLPLYFYVGYQVIQKNCNRTVQSQILLLEALKSNRRDYVHVLLEQGILLRIEDLLELYHSTVGCEKCGRDEDCLHMSWVLRQAHEEAGVSLCNHREDSNGPYRKSSAPRDVRAKATFLVIKLLGYKEKGEDVNQNKYNKDDASTVALHDLLLWSIFANRPDLSEIIWLLSEDHLMTAVFCAVLLKKLAKKANNVKEQVLSRQLTVHAKLFSQRYMRMLDGLYEEDPRYAMEIVDSETTFWSIKTTPLTFAHENFEMDFIGSTCPQRRLYQIWYNELAPDLTPFLKSICRRPLNFATAPITLYFINYFFFLLMLIAFSAFVMTSVDDDLYRRSIARVWEYYTYIWAFGDFIEEIKHGLGIFSTGGMSHRGYWSRMKRHFYDFWNAVDLTSYILLILALIVRHSIEGYPYTIARRLFALSLLIMYIRFLQLFLMNRRLGPTLIMIKEMLKDLLYFLVIASIVIVGTGTYYHANLYPNHINFVGTGSWSTWHIWKIFYYPYWQLYGEPFNEFLEVQDQPNCTSNRSLYETNSEVERCAEKDPTVPVVAAVYMLISNLLLVNLVIAMFSYTFDSVMANSEMLWRFERYTVITNYEGKVPSPLNIIIRPFQLTNCARQRFKRCKCDPADDPEKEERRLQKLHIQKMIASRIPESCDLNIA